MTLTHTHTSVYNEIRFADPYKAWRVERKTPTWEQSREEVLQVAAVAIRALRDAL